MMRDLKVEKTNPFSEDDSSDLTDFLSEDDEDDDFESQTLVSAYLKTLQFRLGYFGYVTFITITSILLGALLQATFSMESDVFAGALPLVITTVMLPACLWAGAIYLDEVYAVTLDGLAHPPLKLLRHDVAFITGCRRTKLGEYATYLIFEAVPALFAIVECSRKKSFGFSLFLSEYIEGALIWFTGAVLVRLSSSFVLWLYQRLGVGQELPCGGSGGEQGELSGEDSQVKNEAPRTECHKVAVCSGMSGTALLLLTAVALLRACAPSSSFHIFGLSPIILVVTVATLMFSWSTRKVAPHLIKVPYYILVVLYLLLACSLSGLRHSRAMDVNEVPTSMPVPILQPPPVGTQFAPVSLEGVYGACMTKWSKPGVSQPALQLTTLDVALLSAVVYNFNETYVQFLLDQEYGRTALQDVKLEYLHDRNTVGRWGIFYFPSSQVRVFAIRGTATADDAIADTALFTTIKIMQLFDKVIPLLSFLPTPLVQKFVSMFDLRRIWGVPPLWENILDAARKVQKQCDADGVQMIVTGHSLGGALAAIVSGKLKIPGLALSPPGTLYTCKQYGLTESDLERNFVIIQPSKDVVPEVDQQLGMLQRIGCSAAALHCHSAERTCCTLRQNCGDPRGRILSTDNAVCKAVADGN
eukprot:TRINITY_DN28983_c0_g2_i1.p1 TRINITY_DN28983_c0_g2~~TRINITY_DN28983_c0_g2_i1.p1  ORF type:complete len:642 (-),score=87.08 TRINITY_DN28983_c0_g2_i1:86-2011(-)